MADWKQITARIRRARTGKDPAGQLSNLYEKTRDAMVAFELAKYFETAGQSSDSAKWYLTAADRFRRADWKTKAQEAAVRLGGELPSGTVIASSSAAPADDIGNRVDDLASASPAGSQSDSESVNDENTGKLEAAVVFSSQMQAATDGSPESSASEAEKKRRRRGRRGGKNRRKPGIARELSSAPVQRSVESTPTYSSPSRLVSENSDEPAAPRVPHARSMPSLPVEPVSADAGGPSVKGRFGDPGLSSRMSLLEMQFRRLLTCPPAKLEEADRAPVGPGVFVLTDSDLTTYYYVETCQTLRIAVSNLAQELVGDLD